MSEAAPPEVFISYSHDSPEHRDRVLEFCDELRVDGIDAMIDLYVQSPPEGWPNWCKSGIENAQFVLMVCTEIYLRRIDRKEEPGVGHGVLWEGRLINQHLYDAGSVSAKFVPVLFADGSPDHVPAPVKGGTIYRIETPEGYEALLRLLTAQPLTPITQLGRLDHCRRRSGGHSPFPSSPPSSPPPCRTPGSRICSLDAELSAKHSLPRFFRPRGRAARSSSPAWRGSGSPTSSIGSSGRMPGGFPAAICGWLSTRTSPPAQRICSRSCATA
jgi:TIR domain